MGVGGSADGGGALPVELTDEGFLTVEEACAMAAVRKSFFYPLLKPQDGKPAAIASAKLGRRRVVSVVSLKRYLAGRIEE